MTSMTGYWSNKTVVERLERFVECFDEYDLTLLGASFQEDVRAMVNLSRSIAEVLASSTPDATQLEDIAALLAHPEEL